MQNLFLAALSVLALVTASNAAQAQSRPREFTCAAKDGLNLSVDLGPSYMLPIRISSYDENILGNLVSRRSPTTIRESMLLHVPHNCVQPVRAEGFACAGFSLIDTSYQYLDLHDELTVNRRVTAWTEISVSRTPDRKFVMDLKILDASGSGYVLLQMRRTFGVLDSGGISESRPGCSLN